MLTTKQKKFCDFYIQTGDATNSAIKAGYSKKTSYAIGCENLKKIELKNYIKERNDALSSTRIADMKEIKELWTKWARDEENKLQDRMKATDLIAKTNGAYLEKIEHSGTIDVSERAKEIDEYFRKK